MKRVFLFIFLSILLLIIILERKSNFTVGTKYTYNKAFVNSVVLNSYNRSDSNNYTTRTLNNVARIYRNVRSNKVRHAGLRDIVGMTFFSKAHKYNQIRRSRRLLRKQLNFNIKRSRNIRGLYNVRMKRDIEELLKKQKSGTLSSNEEKILKSLSPRNIKRYTSGYNNKLEENYENSFKKSLENNSILKSLQDKDIDRYRRMAELRMLNKKSGLMKAFKKRDEAKENMKKLEERKRRLYLNKSKLLAKYNKTQTKTFEEILADSKVSNRKKRELTNKKKQINLYNKKMRKLDSKIEKATLKLEKRRSEINKAKRKAENARKKYNNKQKRKKDRKEILPKISKLKSVSKKALKLGKKRIAVK